MRQRIGKGLAAALLLGATGLVSPLGAVEISAGGEGGALVYPLWATSNGHLSVFSVVDGGWMPSAVKLLVRDAQGEARFTANVYLGGAQDSWTASIVALPDGRSRLASTDGSCVLVGDEGTLQPWSGSVELDADHGYIEAIAMGTVALGPFDTGCEALIERWTTGAWSQDPNADLLGPNAGSSLRGTLNLVHVQKGTAYGIPATALREFSDISQHTLPASPVPDLTSAHDEGTSTGATRSRSCDAQGCVEDTWATPRDAVAAALMVGTIQGEYTHSPSLGGRTDLVFTYPVPKRFGPGGFVLGDTARFDMSTMDREGRLIGGLIFCTPLPPPEGCAPYWSWEHQKRVGFISFPDQSQQQPFPGAVLGLPVPGHWVSQPAPGDGAFRASIQGTTLTSNGGRTYRGAPLIGVVLQQFENGNLVGEDGVQQRANYGVVSPMTRRIGRW